MDKTASISILFADRLNYTMEMYHNQGKEF